MGERRFEHGEEYGEGDMYIWDNVFHKEIWAYDDLNEVCDLLNECQSIISALKEENERLKKRLYLYEMNEDEVDKYLRTHPMPTITNERTIIPLGMRHRCD